LVNAERRALRIGDHGPRADVGHLLWTHAELSAESDRLPRARVDIVYAHVGQPMRRHAARGEIFRQLRDAAEWSAFIGQQRVVRRVIPRLGLPRNDLQVKRLRGVLARDGQFMPDKPAVGSVLWHGGKGEEGSGKRGRGLRKRACAVRAAAKSKARGVR